MANFLWYVFIIALLALAAAAIFFVVRSYMNGTSPRVALFGHRPPPRLAVVDHASIDGRRRLILVRRDDTEHLIMTGGPVDVVIETGIAAPERPALEPPKPVEEIERVTVQPVFARTPRAASGGSSESAAG